MRAFVTGATGFIGSALVAELLGAGHQVIGLARSDASAKSLAAAAAQAHRGSLDDLDSLTRGAAASDGVIHVAFNHDDFTKLAAAGNLDRLAIEALGAGLAGTGRPLVVTSATSLLRRGRLVTEDEMPDPNAPAKHRVASEEATIALVSRGVRASLVRLPPSVHGDGDHAFIPALIGIARAKGVSAYVGDGSNRWPAIHRLDAALLFRLAFEKGIAGSHFHGVADEGIPFRQIAEVIGRRLNLPVVSKSADEAAGHFGWIAAFVTLDGPTSNALTQKRLDWHPKQPGLIADLDRPEYFKI